MSSSANQHNSSSE